MKLSRSAILVTCFLAWSAAAQDNQVWFVHATDPHLFDEPKRLEPAVRQHQQGLNQKALAGLLEEIDSLPGVDGSPSFLVLTGDLGIDPCWIAPEESQDCAAERDPARREGQVKRLAELLGGSPVQDIYLVPGNNDIERERAAGPPLAYAVEFLDDVQKELAGRGSRVRLHNLARCYLLGAAGLSGCFADIPGTPYRLVGFPSHSFKNSEAKDEPDSYAVNAETQEEQVEKFGALVERAQAARKKVLVVTHIPEIDDPYFQAQEKFQLRKPDLSRGNPDRPAWSTWNVSPRVLDIWRQTLESATVSAVLAGHLHDSHRAIYRQPYSWSTPSSYRPEMRKLFLAPPLAVKLQDRSPIQARGFSLVRLGGEGINARLFWYEHDRGTFSPDPGASGGGSNPAAGWRGWPLWLWNLGAEQKPLERLAVLAIAVLAAFLTVVQIWRAPLPQPRRQAPERGGPAGNATRAARPAETEEPESPFASRFGKTVISGLGGLAAVTVLQSLRGQQATRVESYYVVWFTLSFFGLLVLGAFLQGVVEGVRSRVAIEHRPPSRQPSPRGPQPAGERHSKWDRFRNQARRFWQWADYWARRFWQWAVSLRLSLLVVFDTTVSLIQGKNQTRTVAFERTIVRQQRTLVRAADALREQLTHLLRRRLPASGDLGDVRVNISVLSADESSVFYIARAPGSSTRPFNKRSVAWVSLFTKSIRWFKRSYRTSGAYENIVLFENSGEKIPGAEPQMMLSSHYQWRDGDYEAFIVLPVPRRALSADYVRGGIHISFDREEAFEQIWDDRNIKKDPKDYSGAEKMLELRGEENRELRAVLHASIEVLGELLRGFNESIFKAYIEPELLA